ncbi:MAG: hypothetical protein ACLFR0_03275 [Alphaproteobacteria bacterium]
MTDFTDQDLADAIQAHLWHEGYGRIDTYDNIKIIANDYGAMPFDQVFDEALHIILYGQNCAPERLPLIKAMTENRHNTLVDLEQEDPEISAPAPSFLH